MELKQSGYFLARTLSYEASHSLMFLSKYLCEVHPAALPPSDLLDWRCKYTTVIQAPNKGLQLL